VYNEITDHRSVIECDYLTDCDEITNDLSYFKILYDLELLFPVPSYGGTIEDNDYNMIVSLFADVVGTMGAGAMDYKQLLKKIELKTGGVSAETHAFTPLIHESEETICSEYAHLVTKSFVFGEALRKISSKRKPKTF